MFKTRSMKFVVLIIGMLLVQALASGAVAADTTVTFPNSNLEAVIRASTSKPSGDIYLNDVQNITELDAGGKGISNIEGLQYLSNLQVLYLNDNDISDISPLKGLIKLNTLGLCNDKVSDASPLSGLSELSFLSLYNNKLQDISALKNLKKLRTLKLANNPITDFSPIYDIYNKLEEKDFSINSSSDVNAQAGETSFTIGSNKYLVKGVSCTMDAEPYINDNGYTMVPFRYLAASLGVPDKGILWNAKTQLASLMLNKDSYLISVRPNDNDLYIYYVPVLTMGTKPMIKEGRLYLPARYIAEALGHSISWDENLKKVVIGEKNSYNGVLTAKGLREKCSYLQAASDENWKTEKILTPSETTTIYRSYSANSTAVGMAYENWFVYCNTIGIPTNISITDPQTGNSRGYRLRDKDWWSDPNILQEHVTYIKYVRYRSICNFEHLPCAPYPTIGNDFPDKF